MAQTVYKKLASKDDAVYIAKQKWEQKLNCEFSQEFMVKQFTSISRMTNVPKLRSFQYRLLHNAIVLNMHMYRWKLREDNLCSFCGSCKETIEHVMWKCDKVFPIWCQISEWFRERYAQKAIDISCISSIIFLQPGIKMGHVNNLLVLITKQYIYKCRCQQKMLNLAELKSEIKLFEATEKYIAKKNGKLTVHLSKWYPSNKNTFLDEAELNDYIENYVNTA